MSRAFLVHVSDFSLSYQSHKQHNITHNLFDYGIRITKVVEETLH